jgi:hypothetical protein
MPSCVSLATHQGDSWAPLSGLRQNAEAAYVARMDLAAISKVDTGVAKDSNVMFDRPGSVVVFGVGHLAGSRVARDVARARQRLPEK